MIGIPVHAVSLIDCISFYLKEGGGGKSSLTHQYMKNAEIILLIDPQSEYIDIYEIRT